ncbi:A24 family peptidase [Thermovenabulum sp.]|uniref:A24 family peptidase n=1 Tax=Thermovenabulum sp. TaxID=3100335 RepID=UPI003C7E3ADE
MEILRGVILITLLFLCFLTDITKNKIYNFVVFPAMVLGISINGFFDGFSGIIQSVEGMLLGMAFLIIPYVLRGIGAGDVKFLGAIGAIMGPGFTLNAFLFSAIAGGIISLAIMLSDKNLRYKLKAVFLTFLSMLGLIPKGLNLLENLDSPVKKGRFPYGVAITFGTLLAFLFPL